MNSTVADLLITAEVIRVEYTIVFQFNMIDSAISKLVDLGL